jgi:RNA polymerase sigma-70 factor (sigma-E family)
VTEPGPGDFKEFVQLRSDKLLHFAFWMTGNWEDAKDAVQESLAKAYLVWERVRQPDAYVHRLVINSARNSYRARRREVLVADPPEFSVADSGLEAIAARAVLVGALRRLPRRQRAVVVLRCCLDLSVADVASLLHCSTGTVKSQLSKGLAKLGQDPELGPGEMTTAIGEGGRR